MASDKIKSQEIDDYIIKFSPAIQSLLESLRQTIRQAAPEAEEGFSYQMPTFMLNGNLVYFAAFQKHIGFYPTPSGIAAFAEELAIYKGGKGSIQFPIDQPLPLNLIAKIVKFRVQKNLAKKK